MTTLGPRPTDSVPSEVELPLHKPLPAGETRPPKVIPAVDGLRGLAAGVIVIYHSFTESGLPEWRPLTLVGLNFNVLRPLHDGWAGVNLFLVLSGFCLFWPLARDPYRPQRSYGAFVRRRARRILPAYYFSLLAVPAAVASIRFAGLLRSNASDDLPNTVFDVLSHVALLHGLFPQTTISWNSVTWSLGLEWTWYLMFPVVAAAALRFGMLRALAACAIICIIFHLVVWSAMTYGLAPSPTRYDDMVLIFRANPLARLFEFCLGMTCAWFIAKRTPPAGIGWAAAGGSVLLLFAGHVATPLQGHTFLPVRFWLYGFAASLLVVASVASGRRTLGRALTSGPLRRLGECSYSLYLLHLPILMLIVGLLQGAGIERKSPALFFATLMLSPLTLPIAWIAYRWVEVPFLAPASRPGDEVRRRVVP